VARRKKNMVQFAKKLLKAYEGYEPNYRRVVMDSDGYEWYTNGACQVTTYPHLEKIDTPRDLVSEVLLDKHIKTGAFNMYHKVMTYTDGEVAKFPKEFFDWLKPLEGKTLTFSDGNLITVKDEFTCTEVPHNRTADTFFNLPLFRVLQPIQLYTTDHLGKYAFIGSYATKRPVIGLIMMMREAKE
jgi:hypothetical protein